MVQVRFVCPNVQNLADADDLFMSVRVGKKHQLGKLSSACKIKPGDIGSDKPERARLDIFQRIGGCSLTFDATSGLQRELRMPCGGRDINVTMDVFDPEATTEPLPKPHKGPNEHDVTNYLDSHADFRSFLQEAVQAVLTNQPENPIAFLADYLRRTTGIRPTTPAHDKASKTVYCDGIYDLCHVGHQNLFRNAAKHGDRVLVGVVGDADAQKYKRPPIMTAAEREAAVQGCKCVSGVIANAPCFGLTEEFISTHGIDVVCCGQEYVDRFPNPDDDPYYKVPRKMGIVIPLPRTEGLSTSDLIQRINPPARLRGVSTLSEEGAKTVYCDGIFDLCHIGHQNLFVNAAKLVGEGGSVVVGVVNDDDAERYKRPPIMKAHEREAAVGCCKKVNKVISNAPCFGLTEDFLKEHGIDIVAFGQDYMDRFPDPNDDPYYKVPRKMGIAVPIPRTEGVSSSDLIERIQVAPRLRKRLSSAGLQEDFDVETPKAPAKTVYCDGIYDLCHVGHKNLFRNAAKFGRRVLVGVVGDEDANKYKRPPIMTAAEREAAVFGCKCVWQVVSNAPCFGLTEEFIQKHSIDIVCFGQEYEDRFPDPNDDPYYKVPRMMGIGVPLPRTQGLSTSDLIRRIQARDKE